MQIVTGYSQIYQNNAPIEGVVLWNILKASFFFYDKTSHLSGHLDFQMNLISRQSIISDSHSATTIKCYSLQIDSVGIDENKIHSSVELAWPDATVILINQPQKNPRRCLHVSSSRDHLLFIYHETRSLDGERSPRMNGKPVQSGLLKRLRL